MGVLRAVFNALRYFVRAGCPWRLMAQDLRCCARWPSAKSKLQEAKRGFVLRPRRWVVECSFGWAVRFRRIARDYERLTSSHEGVHWLAFVGLMLNSLFR